MTREFLEEMQQRAADMLSDAGIVITEKEKKSIEVLTYGFNDPSMGFQILTYVNTDYVCAKELIMLPGQTCVQHIHPSHDSKRGKEETFRCRKGIVYLRVPGERTEGNLARVPKGHEEYLTLDHEIVLGPGEQHTLLPDTWHWFQAGPEGCIVSEFSTHSDDETDILSDPRAVRFETVE